MAAEKQIPLNEILFGPSVDPTAERAPSLAEVFSAWRREWLASLRRDQAASRSSVLPPFGEPAER